MANVFVTPVRLGFRQKDFWDFGAASLALGCDSRNHRRTRERKSRTPNVHQLGFISTFLTTFLLARSDPSHSSQGIYEKDLLRQQ